MTLEKLFNDAMRSGEITGYSDGELTIHIENDPETKYDDVTLKFSRWGSDIRDFNQVVIEEYKQIASCDCNFLPSYSVCTSLIRLKNNPEFKQEFQRFNDFINCKVAKVIKSPHNSTIETPINPNYTPPQIDDFYSAKQQLENNKNLTIADYQKISQMLAKTGEECVAGLEACAKQNGGDLYKCEEMRENKTLKEVIGLFETLRWKVGGKECRDHDSDDEYTWHDPMNMICYDIRSAFVGQIDEAIKRFRDSSYLYFIARD